MHTFLGSVTRVSLASDLGGLVADVPSLRALTMPPDTRTSVKVEPGGCPPVVPLRSMQGSIC